MQSGWCCYLPSTQQSTLKPLHRFPQTPTSIKWPEVQKEYIGFFYKFDSSGSFCVLSHHLSRSISYVRQKVSFSIFLFSHPFHSVSSFTVCWALDGDSVCWRGTALDVCLCVYIKVHHGVDPGWCDISLFAWFFFLCMFLQLSGRCVHGYICGENKCRSGVTFSIITFFMSHVSVLNTTVDS